MKKRLELLKKSIEFISVLKDLATDDFYEVKFVLFANASNTRVLNYLWAVFELAEAKRPLMLTMK